MRPITVTSVPASIGAAVWLHAYPAARTRSHPSSILTTMISMEMIASSTKSPRPRISAPSVMRSKYPSGGKHDDEDACQGQRNGCCHNESFAPTKADESNDHDDCKSHKELQHELIHCFAD